ncbi:hypothetical protein ABKP09_10490 [Peribacillus frigoritolerans]|uniref:hypothetical protein n=1 Tax=Peribacillus frigoritolerans TaxID=450367 RepID=UPI0032B52D1A
MGIVFLNIVDSEGKSKTLDDYALAYVGVEIVIVSFAPELMMTGHHWLITLVTVVAGSLILLFPKLRGMWVKLKRYSVDLNKGIDCLRRWSMNLS